MPSIIRKNKPSPCVGFTLVELLLVTVMLAVISLTVFATFNNAIKIMSRVKQGIPEEDIYILLDRFTGDVSNSLIFTGLAFKGSENSLELVTLVQSPRLQMRTVGKVIYSYDEKAGVLDREQLDFSHLYSHENGYLAHALGNIKSLKFSYCSYDPVKKEYQWQGEWAKEGLPSAIRLEFEFENKTVSNKFSKTVSIPVSG